MPLDDTTVRVYSILFIAITAVLVYTARYFHARRSRRSSQQQSIGSNGCTVGSGRASRPARPLHLALAAPPSGRNRRLSPRPKPNSSITSSRRPSPSDSAPLISTASTATVPLAQDTIRRAWRGDAQWKQVQWYPQGDRSIAYAAGVSAMMGVDEPSAHILAGSFGPELALMLNSAEQLGQGTLAVSDQLDGQAIAFAMADEVLIGEQMFSAAAQLSSDTTALADARALDVWRGLLIAGLSILLLLNFTKQLQFVSWSLVLIAALGLLIIGAILFRRS